MDVMVRTHARARRARTRMHTHTHTHTRRCRRSDNSEPGPLDCQLHHTDT